MYYYLVAYLKRLCGTAYLPARHSLESLFTVVMLFVHVFTLKDASKTLL